MANIAPSSLAQSPLRNESRPSSSHSRPLPIHTHSATPSDSTSTSEDPMDLTPVNTNSMGPPGNHSPNGKTKINGGNEELSSAVGSAQMSEVNNSAREPKVVQTAFISKLYGMLEDTSIQHLISWSHNNESFLISPSGDFSKVLASYFKHTNISSFVRQLNMYGFHKVSDVFPTAAPDTPLWEFKHGNGSFKKGDIAALRDIKRRASKSALNHRDSFSAVSKMGMPQNGSTAEPTPDSLEGRMTAMEQNFYDTQVRLARTEDSQAIILSKYQMLSETLAKCLQYNHDLSSALLSMVPEPEHPMHRDVAAMQKDVRVQMEHFRVFDTHASQPPPFSHNMSMEPPQPVSPRQIAQDRRPSVFGGHRTSSFRTPAPQRLSPRHFGSIGNGTSSPSGLRPLAPPLPAPQVTYPPNSADLHSLSPSFPSRRHTSADIRLENGWIPNLDPSQNMPPHSQSGYTSTQWPPSPQPAPDLNNADQQIRESLARYSLSSTTPTQASSLRPPLPSLSRNPSPPGAFESAHHYANGNHYVDNGWTLPSARFNNFSKDVFRNTGVATGSSGYDTPGPSSRRTSMASNVHNLLNPTQESEEEDLLDDDIRKRKRLG